MGKQKNSNLEATRLKKLEDPRYRLNHLYRIIDKSGNEIIFKENPEQEHFLNNMWYLNVILKARQLGFTTLIQLFMLDRCVFNSNVTAGVIAHTQLDAKAIFRNKIKFAYDRLPPDLRNAVETESDSAQVLEFSNGSSISVGTSMRGGTLQYLHISEFGKICAKYPEKAVEIVTGALNAVEAGCVIWVESTAEGQWGEFYKMCQIAMALKAAGKTLTVLDFKFHFYAWHSNKDYWLEPKGVIISPEMVTYFTMLQTEHGVLTNDGQRAWYTKKSEQQGEHMKREFPSFPEEAFEQTILGSILGDKLTIARKEGRICRVPHDSALLVDTHWDLGMNDKMAIWFVQRHFTELRFIRYYEFSGEGLEFYFNYMRELKYSYGEHFAPHDITVRELGTGISRLEKAAQLGIDFNVTARIDKQDQIEAARTIFSRCYFDEVNCADGIKHLNNWRREWNDKMGCLGKKPLHNDASNAADAFCTLALNSEDDGPREAKGLQTHTVNDETNHTTGNTSLLNSF